jgi:hypothetical protein
MCVGVDGDDYKFRPHEPGMIGSTGKNGDLFKLVIPASERIPALRNLDLMNINPYSLFGTEDALIRTVARRECLFRSWSL